MIVRANLPKWFCFDAITIWPFIFVRPEHTNNAALIAHEQAHLIDQRNWLVLPWWLLYLVSPRFRFRSEVIGHAAQVKVGGCTVQWAAAHIVNRYWTFCTFAEAESAVTKKLKE